MTGAITAILLAVVVATPARSSTPVRVALVALDTPGVGSGEERSVAERLRRDARDAGLELVEPGPLERPSLACLVDPTCVVAVAAEQQCEGLLVVVAQQRRGIVRLELQAFRGRDGEPLPRVVLVLSARELRQTTILRSALRRLGLVLRPRDPGTMDAEVSSTVEPAVSSGVPRASTTRAAEVSGDQLGSGAAGTDEPEVDADGALHPLLVVGGGGALGAGGLVLAGSAIPGVMALLLERRLHQRCPDRRCPPEQHGDVDSLNTLLLVNTLLTAAGLLSAAVGGGVLLVALVGGPTNADDEVAP